MAAKKKPATAEGLKSPKRPVRGRVVRSPNVCGGSPRIRGTRIPVWGIAAAREEGFSDDQIVELYPALTSADLLAAFQYAERHATKISREIRDNQG